MASEEKEMIVKCRRFTSPPAPLLEERGALKCGIYLEYSFYVSFQIPINYIFIRNARVSGSPLILRGVPAGGGVKILISKLARCLNCNLQNYGIRRKGKDSEMQEIYLCLKPGNPSASLVPL
jgi:hypothetical protein